MSSLLTAVKRPIRSGDQDVISDTRRATFCAAGELTASEAAIGSVVALSRAGEYLASASVITVGDGFESRPRRW